MCQIGEHLVSEALLRLPGVRTFAAAAAHHEGVVRGQHKRSAFPLEPKLLFEVPQEMALSHIEQVT